MPSTLEKGTYYTVPEVAKVLNKSNNTVYTWLKEGLIKYAEISNTKLISHVSLCALLEENDLPESIIAFRLHTDSQLDNSIIASDVA